MFVLIRAIIYASIFIGLFLVFVPAQILRGVGITQPETIGAAQVIGMVVGVLGAFLALWCVLTFALIGKGTPAPFDAPRRLVIRGPYRYVRNPMYIGAIWVLAGVTVYYQSLAIFLFTIGFWVAAHFFIIFYEEPVLLQKFGVAYGEYKINVNRWRPNFGNGK